jgi:N-acetylmuramoyl-L-alanine amidase
MTPGFDFAVTDGDCVSTIAARFGFHSQTVWDANPDLKSLRKNPNVLFPGDIVKIPDRVGKNLPCATEQRHQFVKKGTPAKFRVILERFNVPLANRRYILEIDGQVFDGETDGSGLLEVAIDPAAQSGHLQLPDDQLECQLELGYLDPLDEIKGVQQRLQNLGFLAADANGEMDDETRHAITWFQSSVNLPPTGDLDDATRSKLFHMQDEVHPQSTDENEAPESESASSSEPEEIEPEIDPEDDEAQLARLTSFDE